MTLVKLLNVFIFCLQLSPLKAETVDADFFSEKIQPLFESRCVQCHSCYNSPCQLNLGSVEGLDRGLVSNFKVYSPSKLRPSEPSRLGIDRKTTEGWRNFSDDIHFQPVTYDTGDTNDNLSTSFIYRLVNQKASHPNLSFDDLVNPDFLPELSRTCPDTPRKLTRHIRRRPEAGMPYGLPALTETQVTDIKKWTEAGSPRQHSPEEIPDTDKKVIGAIQKFMNSHLANSTNQDETKKQGLVSRYIYEHLFLAHLYLHEEKAPKYFYRMIRSSSKCETSEEVATRRPWDKVTSPFYYCLKRVEDAIVHKTHIPYLANIKKVERWKQLFYSKDWQVSFSSENIFDIAPREDEKANNPFYIFKDIPSAAKYQFLLDDAQYHIMTFIKGPVCKGNIAVNSIDEQFHVFFLKPNSDLTVRNQEFAEKAIPNLVLPAVKGSGQVLGGVAARLQRNARNRYRVLRNQYYNQEFPTGYSVTDLWNGANGLEESSSQVNNNAALTVFRHEDSAAVVKGLIGATPKTVFVLDYAIFERIYYNLVAGFDVYGDASHQLQTRLYMAYTRMEAEENFLSFLPSSYRAPMHRSWYLPTNTNTAQLLGKPVSGSFPLLGLENENLQNHSSLDEGAYNESNFISKLETLRDARKSVINQFRRYLGDALVENSFINTEKALTDKVVLNEISETSDIDEFEIQLSKTTDLTAYYSPWVLKMPSVSLLLVEAPSGPEVYTLIRNKEHFNIAWLSHENERRNQAADTISVYKGVMTSYPNHIFHISVDEGHEFLKQMISINDHESYESWIRAFGRPRSGSGSENFWSTSDRIHQVMQQKFPLEYGILDYNRYGMDYRYSENSNIDFFDSLPRSLKDTVTKDLGIE